MNWFKRKLRQWLNSDDEDCFSSLSHNTVKARRIDRDDIDSNDGISMTLRHAVGGRIVSFRTYDQKSDRHNYKLYVIPEDQDFERELGKIITLESMRY